MFQNLNTLRERENCIHLQLWHDVLHSMNWTPNENISIKGGESFHFAGLEELSLIDRSSLCKFSQYKQGISQQLKFAMIYVKKTLLNARQTQGIEYFDSFDTFSSKQKLQQALKSWWNFSFVLFGKGRERTTLTNQHNNFKKINLAVLTNPGNIYEKSIYLALMKMNIFKKSQH